MSWLERDLSSKLFMHCAELQDLVERDDTAARLPAAATRSTQDISEKCSVSTDVESAVPENESGEVRYDLELQSGHTTADQLVLTC